LSSRSLLRRSQWNARITPAQEQQSKGSITTTTTARSKRDLSDLPSCEQEKQELVVVFVQFVLFLKIIIKKNSYYLQRRCVFLLTHSINPFLLSFPSLSLSRSLARLQLLHPFFLQIS